MPVVKSEQSSLFYIWPFELYAAKYMKYIMTLSWDHVMEESISGKFI